MNRILRKLAMAPALLGLLGIIACSKQVTIAVPVPLTGDQAGQGEDVLHGAQLAVDQWNAKGGVLNTKIKLVSADDKGDADTAASLAKDWGNEKVAAVIGHYNSSSTLAALEVYYAKRTLMITPSSTNADVTKNGYPTIFRVCGRDDQQAKVAADYVMAAFPGAKVAVLNDKSPYGQELADAFLIDYKGASGKESVYYTGFDRSTSDFAPVVAKLKEAQPTVVYFGGLFLQGAALVKEMRAEGLTAAFMSGDGCYDPDFIRRAGAASEGALCTFYPDVESLTEARSAVAAYKQAFGKAPGPYSMLAYVATDLALQAMQKAGTTDSLKVSSVLHSNEFQTIMGNFKFDTKGDPAKAPWVIWKVDGGKFVVAPKPVPAPVPAQPVVK